MAIDGTHGLMERWCFIGPQFIILCLLHKRKTNKGLCTANNLNEAFCDVKK